MTLNGIFDLDQVSEATNQLPTDVFHLVSTGMLPFLKMYCQHLKIRKLLRRNVGFLSYLLKSEGLAKPCSLHTCPKSAGGGEVHSLQTGKGTLGAPCPYHLAACPPVIANNLVWDPYSKAIVLISESPREDFTLPLLPSQILVEKHSLKYHPAPQ